MDWKCLELCSHSRRIVRESRGNGKNHAYILRQKREFTRVSISKLEDLKVLRRSPDLLNNVKIGQGFTIYGGCRHLGQVT